MYEFCLKIPTMSKYMRLCEHKSTQRTKIRETFCTFFTLLLVDKTCMYFNFID